MSDQAFGAYMALMGEEWTTERVTDPDEVEALRRQFGYLPKKRRWPSLHGGLAPAPAVEAHP